MEFRFESITFSSNFDSGNLAAVTRVDKSSSLSSTSAKKQDNDFAAQQIGYDYEFNLWTSPDAAGTPYVNPNRTWFYFSVSGVPQFKIIKFNIMNLNKQGKLYSQGYTPMFKVKCFNTKVEKWERVKDKISYETVGSELILTFHHFFSEVEAITYFAFSYPWSYTDCQAKLEAFDIKLLPLDYTFIMRSNMIYYHRELLVHSLDGLRVDLITISDHSGISNVEEPRFDKCLFPNKTQPRCKMFANKKVFFVSSRVHPGETPSSHVFNGFLDFILRKNDPRAEELRRRYVFKLIPMLNPDGVSRGFYRTDQHGVNLNRVYLDPTFSLYPSIYASKSLLAYYHIGCDDFVWKTIIKDSGSCNVDSTVSDDETFVKLLSKVEHKKGESDVFNASANVAGSKKGPDENSDCFSVTNTDDKLLDSNQRQIHHLALSDMVSVQDSCLIDSPSNIHERFFTNADNAADTTSSYCSSSKITNNEFSANSVSQKVSTTPHLSHPFYLTILPEKSGLAYYIDLHAHASKKGCFFYGNHFGDIDKQIQCRTYAKLVSMNTGHLDYDGCNFTERNMYAQDKRENLNKEGSARVAIFKHLGIVNSYTLECNYNTGRLTNLIPHASGDSGRATPPPSTGIIPQKYNISHFEEVGRALAISALDAEEANPWTRLTRSEFISLSGVRDWVKKQLFFEGLPVSCAPSNGNAHENINIHRTSRVHKLSDSKIPQTSQLTSKNSNSSKHSNKTSVKVTPLLFTPHTFEIPNSSMLSTSPKSKAVKSSYKKLHTVPVLKAVHPKS
ncbi:hypothetical protein HELRODRAFT_191938 [Helobdella robusta]|uniref:Cytosolic carboxypeptidase-like protein 5 n=1 Tax=Helobdella robusta TaxID=6412 RepID=T1FTF3_HELRO|nr:hypothetical protein HELRODRAFT_191938 [Helobdella robusta]ESO03726.1 hypothetical protein HELRODRAFT_191938 [Helobdella robusta]